MKGHWHIFAISVTCSILTVYFNSFLFFIALVIWLLYLYFYYQLGHKQFIFALLFFFFFCYYIPSISEANLDVTNDIEQEIDIKGKIVSPVKTTPAKTEFIIQDERYKERMLAVIFHNNDEEDVPHNLPQGAICFFQAHITSPDGATNPGQFDYQLFLKKQGFNYQLIIPSIDHIKCDGHSFFSFINKINSKLNDHMKKKASSYTSAWFQALILGNRTFLDAEIIDLFQRWGLSHILAISGLHIGIIVAIFYFLFVHFQLTTKEKAEWIIVYMLPLYAFIAGGQPSVLRASFMVVLLILFKKLKWRLRLVDSVCIVFITLIFFDKYIIYNIGFQFSFIVTFALILSKEWLVQTNVRWVQLLKINFISQFAILPLQVAYFHIFEPLSIIINMLIVPYFSLFVIPFMFILLLTSFFPSVLFFFFESIFLKTQELVIYFLQNLDQSLYNPFVIGEYPEVYASLYYLILFILMKNVQLDKLKNASLYGALFVLFIICLTIRPYFSSVGLVTMLDIGQGDTFIIELPNRKGVFMIDAAANFSFAEEQPSSKIYEQVIKPYLYSRGIQHIDAVFLTHEDIDHIGSAPNLLKEFHVDNVIVSNVFELNKEMDLALKNTNTFLKRVSFNDLIRIKGQDFHILSPKVDYGTRNENSLVIASTIGDKTWLFTGDIGKETEKRMLSDVAKLSIDVLKVGHHGSDTSTSEQFLSTINPNRALISVGRNNRYNHPSDETIELLKQNNIKVFRTDQHGAVQYYFKKEKNIGTFRTFLQ